MPIDNHFMIRKIMGLDQFIVAYCSGTNMPFMVCDPVTYADQVWIFSAEDQLGEFTKRYAGRKVPLRGIIVKKNAFPGFFGSLYTIGVTEVVYSQNDASAKIPLEQFVVRQDLSRIPPIQRPLENPELQLTGLYLMQELTRQVPNEEKEDLKMLDEEFSVNLARSRFAIAIETNSGPSSIRDKLQKRQYSLPILTLKNGDRFQPLFTDILEYNKFRHDRHLELIVAPFASLKAIMSKNVKGFILNPGGFHIVLLPQILESISARFPDEVRKGLEKTKKIRESSAGVKHMHNTRCTNASQAGHSKITKIPLQKDKE